MPVIRHPDELPEQHGPGWSRQAWAGPETFGTPVPMTAARYRRAGEFSFAEFWAPPPADTVWTASGDRCTWAPVA